MKITILALFVSIIMVAGIMVVSTQMAVAGDYASVKIDSNTKWSGSILDSSFDSVTKEGFGNWKFFILCTSYGTYSLVIQKQTAAGTLAVAVTQNNQTLDSKSTNAEYGVVSLAGNCG